MPNEDFVTIKFETPTDLVHFGMRISTALIDPVTIKENPDSVTLDVFLDNRGAEIKAKIKALGLKIEK